MTGLNLKAFEALTPSFAQALAEAPVPRRSKAPRERSVGGGRKPRLATVEDKLIYLLFYFKCYPSDLTAAQFAWLSPSLFSLTAETSPRGRPHTTSLWAILNAIFYVLCEGCTWRGLPGDFLP